jgi:hypothetical protein
LPFLAGWLEHYPKDVIACAAKSHVCRPVSPRRRTLACEISCRHLLLHQIVRRHHP